MLVNRTKKRYARYGALRRVRDYAGPAKAAARLSSGLLLIFGIATYFATDILEKLGVNPGVVPLIAGVSLLLTGYFLRIKRNGWAFAMTAISIATITITLFMILFPRVMVSSLDPAFSLTIYNASSSQYTLQIMTIIAVILVPVVLIYQGWTYYIFRKRLTMETELEY